VSIQNLQECEQLFFEKFSDDVSLNELPLVFILGSPRTGSTLIYQLIINFFDFFYFSNFVNDYFAEYPIIGTALDLQLNSHPLINYESAYGKTKGRFGPSEASLVFKNWFGGEHPAQTCSTEVLPGKVAHFTLTIKSIYKMTGQPILTKNAWNCFRIKAMTSLFPNIHFIWIRRDIRQSALSDLEARYRRGSPYTWNSATTANYQEIQQRPYWEQVVEQQYEYNKSIGVDLKRFSRRQYLELWHEDLCDRPEEELAKINQYFASQSLPLQQQDAPLPRLNPSKRPTGFNEDYDKILNYVAVQPDRFQEYTYKCPSLVQNGF
jgi:hypothetical protein